MVSLLEIKQLLSGVKWRVIRHAFGYTNAPGRRRQLIASSHKVNTARNNFTNREGEATNLSCGWSAAVSSRAEEL